MRRKTVAKRDAILMAAAEAFAELGYERTSMSEISARVGGSKATLYSYFPSKEILFVEATQAVIESLLGGVLDELLRASEDRDIATVLRSFGIHSLLGVTNPQFAAVERMVIAEAGHSDIGKMFFERVPASVVSTISDCLARAMKSGQLRRANPRHAAQHLMGLLESESRHIRHFALPWPGAAELRAGVKRAVDVFMAAYGPLPTATATPRKRVR